MRRVFAWALYDWANSAFATTVLVGFFPVFFKEFWSAEGAGGAGMNVTESTFMLGAANSLASMVVALMAPVLGAIADRGGVRKKFLLYFAVMGIVMTGSLYLVERGEWIPAVALYVAATIGFSGGNVFYDSLIVAVSSRRRMNLVSALGYSLGYLGGGLLFALNVWMTLRPETFGLASSGEAVRVSFLLVALWWAAFSVPIFVFVPEPKTGGETHGWGVVSAGLKQLRGTFAEARRLRVVFLFLVAYWLYIDGVDTIARMAVDYGMSIGFDASKLIVALLITQFISFPSALAMGKAGDWIGTQNAIFLCLGVYVAVTIYSYFMVHVNEFYVLAMAIGLVQGGVQALSRSFYANIIPRSKSAEFFGLYNMLGKFAAVLGPLMIGWVSVATDNPRLSILSVVILFAMGGFLLYLVNEDEGRKMAELL